MAHVLNAVLLPSCIRHGHCRRSSGLDQLSSANKTLSFTLAAFGEQLGTICSGVRELAQLDLAPDALAALFGHRVHISQNVAGDRVAKPAQHKSRYRNADFRPSAFRLV